MTNPVYIQNSFRIRLGDTVGLNVDGGWAALENINATIDGGREFRLRVHFEETVGKGGPQGFQLQGLHPQGSNTWTTLVVDNGPTLGPAIPRLSLQFTDGDAATELLTNQGSTYEDGEGDDTNNSATASPDSTETECEWCILIPRYYFDGTTTYEIDDADTIQFRVVESDDTAFGTYSNTPTITVNHADNWLGGTFAETFMRLGPFIDTNENKYALQEANESDPYLRMMKGVGSVWTAQDVAGIPASKDLECCDIIKNGDTLHIFHYGSNVDYHTFYMSDHPTTPDEWGITDEEIYNSPTADLQCGGIVLLSTDEIVAGYQRADGGFESVFMKIRSAVGVWGSEVEIDTASSIHFYGPMLVREVGSDKVHFFYVDRINFDIYHKSWTSGGGLTSRELVESNSHQSTNNELAMLNPIAWQDGGDEKITIVVNDETDEYLYSVVITNDGSPETRRQVNSVVTHHGGGASKKPTGFLALDGTDVYCFFADEVTQDLWYTKSANDGTWDTPTEFLDVVQIAGISGQTITVSGSDYISMYFDDGSDGYTGNIWYNEYELTGGTVDNLVAVGITTTPVLGVPTIAQEQALSATGITANPVLDTSSIGQKHALAAADTITIPVVGTPTIGQIHSLDAVGITANPVLDTPSVGQEHTLDAIDSTANPVLNAPALAQEHVLDSVGISTTPALDTPTLVDIGQTHVLDAVGSITTPIMGTPAIGQEHTLDAVDITVNPALDTPSIGQEHALDATGITVNPVLDTSSIGQEHALNATGVTANPVLDTPSIGQKQALNATNITANPVLDTPSIGQEHSLDAVDTTVNPVLDTPPIGQEHALDAVDTTANPALGTPVLGTEGEDDLEANDTTTTPVVGTPTIGQTHVLSAIGITTTPVLDTPALGFIFILDATGIETTPVVGTPAIGQTHALSSTGIVTIPEVGIPVFGQGHTLDASGFITTPVLEVSTIGQIHVLDSETILVSPILGVPLAGQTHVLDAVGITTTPEMGVVSFELVDGKVVIVFSAYQPELDFSAYQPELDFTIVYTED